jgi:ribosome biogenesis protein YTM1
VTWISNEDSKYKFLSASHDQSILIWNWNKKTKKLEKADKCVGHTESVECIDLNFDKTKVNFKFFNKKCTSITKRFKNK